MKNNSSNQATHKITGMLISLILIALISIGILFVYPVIAKNYERLDAGYTEQMSTDLIEQEEYDKQQFMNMLYRGNYALFWDLKLKFYKYESTPSDVFISQESTVSDEETDWEDEKDNFINGFNSLLYNWTEEFYTCADIEYPLFNYYVLDQTTGNIISNCGDALELLDKVSTLTEKLKSKYPFYMIIKYSEDGTMSVSDYAGLSQEQVDDFILADLSKEKIQKSMENEYWHLFSDQIKTPTNSTIIYASQSTSFYVPENVTHSYYISGNWLFSESGFSELYLIALIFVTILALLLPFIRSLEIGKGISTAIPFEVAVLAMLIILNIYQTLLMMAKKTAFGNYLTELGFISIPDDVLKVFDYTLNFLIWMLVLCIWYVSVLVIRQIIVYGPKRYIKEKTLLYRFVIWLRKQSKILYRAVIEVDLTTSMNKILIKLLIVNFVILVIFCCTWFIGIALLVPYTVVLFALFRKYLGDMKKRYDILLDATKKMADGNLEVIITENIGTFEPIKNELTKIQYGFKKAVEEEMKSQRLKTDLITNVSHDLKTPLTAIITYINLLKEKNLTEEEKRSYIDTIDIKSLRLKTLIEDLFEVSKASSNNIILNLVEVDIINLIKQVMLELEDKISNSNIEFRAALPDEKVILMLDSEKTYRVFENLIINITKYALPNTRAYIEYETTDELVTIVLKNVSATELTFDTDEISERFVRGDQSRNTEGSGLGLAIVKSFVELQNGKFKIITDGDLYKAVIEWKRVPIIE